ncbi:16937_t:CDS:1, partial [Cetraspora pellucida]
TKHKNYSLKVKRHLSKPGNNLQGPKTSKLRPSLTTSRLKPTNFGILGLVRSCFGSIELPITLFSDIRVKIDFHN